MVNPWDTEPDALDFISDGLPCLMRRSSLGAWCGYVGIGKDHPWFGLPHNTLIKSTRDMLENRSSHDFGIIDLFAHAMRGKGHEQIEICMALRVHGGITWSGELPNEHHQGLFWYGFDCCHAGDLVPKMRRVGFDALKSFMTPEQNVDFERLGPMMDAMNDRAVYRDQQYVVSECQSLAAQLVKIRDIFAQKNVEFFPDRE